MMIELNRTMLRSREIMINAERLRLRPKLETFSYTHLASVFGSHTLRMLESVFGFFRIILVLVFGMSGVKM